MFMKKMPFELRNESVIQQHIDKAVYVKFDHVNSDLPDKTAVILYGVSNDGYITNAGLFQDIWILDKPCSLDDCAVLLLSYDDVDLLPTIWSGIKCIFIKKIGQFDPLYDDEAVFASLSDLYIDQPNVMNVYGSEFGTYYPYIILI